MTQAESNTRLFEPYLTRWHLVPDGHPVVTSNSHLLPTRGRGQPLMLKLTSEQESRGSILMQWWRGRGAARVIARDHGAALLLERAQGTRSLSEMSRSGQDDEACRVLCAVAKTLHAPRQRPIPCLLPLDRQFSSLEAAADGGILCRCAATARQLLAQPRQIGLLHGDIHHDNVLDFGSRGWLAIDPKGLLGERTFDYANIFTNPDLSDPTRPVATRQGRLATRLDIVAGAAGLERRRLLQWVLAWAGLSAAWIIEAGDSADVSIAMAQLAAAELDR